MAVQAIGAKSKVSKRLLPDVAVKNEVRLMAAIAFLLQVGTGQVEAGEAVVKASGFKVDDPEIPAVVVAVAGSTFLAADLGGGMVALLCRDPGLQLTVALEAFLIRHFGAEGMAFGTV